MFIKVEGVQVFSILQMIEGMLENDVIVVMGLYILLTLVCVMFRATQQ